MRHCPTRVVVAITEMARNGKRRKSWQGRVAAPHDLCFAATIRKTMEAISSGLECVEKSGKILHWTEESVIVSQARVDRVNNAVARSPMASDERRAMSDEQ